MADGEEILGLPGLTTTQTYEDKNSRTSDIVGELDERILSWFKKRNGDTLKGALAFIPWVLQQANFEGSLEKGHVVIHRGSGAVVFSDASGFTALTERLSKKDDGAEKLSLCLTSFFTPLIDIINSYRGDVIKFSGDALTIYFQAVDDTKHEKYNHVVPPHGTWGLPDLGPQATAVLRACACCIEIHKRLHMFDTGVDNVRLCLHIGVGCGEVTILQVGGRLPPETRVPRLEYIIAGPPLEQISIAEPLASNGETCLSPQAWHYVKDCVVEGSPLEDCLRELCFAFSCRCRWVRMPERPTKWQLVLKQALGHLAARLLDGGVGVRGVVDAAVQATASAWQWRWALYLFGRNGSSISHVEAVARACSRADEWAITLRFVQEMWDRHQDALPAGVLHAALYSCPRNLWPLAEALLDRLGRRAYVRSYNLALALLPWRRALSLVEQMSLRKLPNEASFVLLISACAKGKAWQVALQGFDELRHTTRLTVRSCNAVINACEKGCQWQRALHFFHDFARFQVFADVVSFSSCISALEKANQWERAESLLSSMLLHGPEPNIITFNAFISAQAIQWQRALDTAHSLPTRSMQSDDFTLVSSISCASWPVANQLLAESKSSSAECKQAYNALAGSNLRWYHSVSLLSGMATSWIETSTVCVAAILRSLRSFWETALALSAGISSPTRISTMAQASQWRLAVRLFHRISLERLDESLEPANAAISACDGGPQWSLALEILRTVRRPKVRTYNVVISACQEGACWLLPLSFLEDMENSLLEADAITVNSMLTCCEKAKRWELGLVLARSGNSGVTLTASVATMATSGFWAKALWMFRSASGPEPSTLCLQLVLDACEVQGTLTYVNEMRHISTIFINGSGLDIMSEKGPSIAQELMSSVQQCCYQHEGTLNKFLIDDKGMLFLLVFGLPPLVHTDDPTRAVLACFDMVKVFKKLQLIGKFGVTTGRSYCGVCGSARRMEYTVLGDCVNLSARLMANAPPNGILCDDITRKRSTTEIIYNALAPIRVKGKEKPIEIFQPVKKEFSNNIGLNRRGTISFPWHQNAFGGMSSGGLSVSEFQDGVIRLCSIKSWSGISRASELLGAGFRKEIHSDKAVPVPSEPSAGSKPPKGSPFCDGGVVVIEGATGTGKIEMAEHMVVHSITTFRMFPVFGTMGPRPGDSLRLSCEMLRSTIGIFRKTNPTLPEDDFEALRHLSPSRRMDLLQQALGKNAAASELTMEKAGEVLSLTVEVVVELLSQFTKSNAVLLIMQFEYGTSLFPDKLSDQDIFWQTVNTVYNSFIKTQPPDGKPRVMMLICRHARDDHPAVKAAEKSNTKVSLKGLEDQGIAEYMSSYLNLPDADSNLIPTPLRLFVSEVTLGNPLYIRETIDQLREHHIQVNEGAGGQVKNVECKDIDKVNVSQWGHTAMIGNTVCALEALDPLEAAVLKMSTCFMGPFTLGDLAASTSSRWAESTHFDFLRLFQIMNFVRAETIVQEITDDGKVRDIITQVRKSEAEQDAERQEAILRSLPEFKRDGHSAADAKADAKAAEAANEQQEKDEAKEYNVHTIDEAEFEHYQKIEDAEREKKRKLKSQDAEAVAMFETERKRLREDEEEKKPDLISIMRQQNLEKSEKRNKAAPTPHERLKGKIKVKAHGEAAKPEPKPMSALAGYGSDSGSE
ncbi:unnamed protein product [Effrenium voratum]|nr:unnamed protein product [Effrenium voratum]